MNRPAATQTHQQKPAATPAVSGVLQRNCDCGNHTIAGGECKECGKKKRLGLQAKLKVNEPEDVYEQEADRFADQVLAGPAQSTFGRAAPHIQRFTGQPSEQTCQTPANVDHVLANPGSPLKSSLREDMEHRFNYDFSRVRVHSGAAAEQSVLEMNAYAYTAGNNIVFGANRFAPETHEGRRLLAHELTHVVQQSDSDQDRIQYKKRPEKNLSIAKVIAFEGRVDSAQAVLSDGTVEPIELVPYDRKNRPLQPGTYTFQLDRSAQYQYRRSDTAERHGGILWHPKSVFESNYEWAEQVTVVILEGDPSTLRTSLGSYSSHIQKFLTTDKGPVGSNEDLQNVVIAANILEGAGVTEDELLLREYGQTEAENYGRPQPGESDVVGWAEDFVVKRQEGAEEALKNRTSFVADRTRLDAWSQDDKNGIKNVAEGILGEEVMHSILRRHGMFFYDLIREFEFELKSITRAFLSQAQVALFRIEKTYLADKNVGMEENRLKQAIEKIRPIMKQRDVAAKKRDDVKDTATVYGLWPVGAVLDPKVAEADAEVKTKDEELQRQSAGAGLPVVGWKGFDRDAIRGGNVESGRSTLRQFVAHAHTQIGSAQRKVEKLETLYKADRMVELTKAAVGIKKGSVFDDIISYRARIETSDEGFWSRLWDIVTIALMFVPGNIGIALRVGAGIVNVTKALDEYAEGMTLHQTGLAIQAPSSLGVFLAVGGTLIDAQQMAKGVFKILDTEASAGAKFGSQASTSAESTVFREAETAGKAGDDVAEQQIAKGAASGGDESAAAHEIKIGSDTKPSMRNNGAGGSNGGGPGGGGSGGSTPRPDIPQNTSVMEFEDAINLARDLSTNRSVYLQELNRISNIADPGIRSRELNDFIKVYSHDTGIRIELVPVTSTDRMSELGLTGGNWGTYSESQGVIYMRADVLQQRDAVNQIGHEVGAAELYRIHSLPKDSIPLVLGNTTPSGGNYLTHLIDLFIRRPE